MDVKVHVQGSRSDKALGIGELFASACNVSAPLDRSQISYYHTKASTMHARGAVTYRS